MRAYNHTSGKRTNRPPDLLGRRLYHTKSMDVPLLNVPYCISAAPLGLISKVLGESLNPRGDKGLLRAYNHTSGKRKNWPLTSWDGAEKSHQTSQDPSVKVLQPPLIWSMSPCLQTLGTGVRERGPFTIGASGGSYLRVKVRVCARPQTRSRRCEARIRKRGAAPKTG